MTSLLRRSAPSLLLALLLAALASGSVSCAVLGRQLNEQPIIRDDVDRVEVGMTNRQVTDILGAPHEIIFSKRNNENLREHAYVYEHSVRSATAVFFGIVNFGRLDVDSDRVVVFLDEEGKVTHVGATLAAEQSALGFPFGR